LRSGISALRQTRKFAEVRRALLEERPLPLLGFFGQVVNSNLDAEGEEAVNKAIVAAKEMGTAVVLITHRSSMLAHVDRVAILKEGQLDIVGQRDQVVAKINRPAVRRLSVVKSGEVAS
jgi:ABC-type protease/lipase transport system fused ATPase/permease subunit